MEGNGWIGRRTCLFNFVKSVTRRTLPSGFGTKNPGLHQGVGVSTGVITLRSISSFIAVFAACV